MDDSGLASTFEFWQRWAEFGAIIVVVGILGEITGVLLESHEKQYFREWWDFRLNPKLFDPIWGGILKWSKPRKLRIEFLSVVLVVGGLIIEIGGSHKAYIASDRLTKSLQLQTEQAKLLSSSNELQVAILTSNNLVLQRKLQPRTITIEQERKFISLCAQIPKVPIKIIVGAADNETEVFAEEIRQVLDDAGFGGSDAGIIRDSTLYMTFPTGYFPMTSLDLMKNDTNMSSIPGATPVPSTLQENIVKLVSQHFGESTGYNFSWIPMNATRYLKQGEAGIVIPPKILSPN